MLCNFFTLFNFYFKMNTKSKEADLEMVKGKYEVRKDKGILLECNVNSQNRDLLVYWKFCSVKCFNLRKTPFQHCWFVTVPPRFVTLANIGRVI